jgi:6-pyruvoyltetrahydropterin/6-carboxytetrahydropterin synthase
MCPSASSWVIFSDGLAHASEVKRRHQILVMYNFSMFSVTKEIHFCYGHRLLNYDGKCRYFHGHNGKVEVTLQSDKLDNKGMVRDFTEIKQILQTWVDATLDHRMILHEKDPLRKSLEDAGEPLFTLSENPTAESIARLIFETAQSKGLPVSAVTLWETPNSFATYSKS